MAARTVILLAPLLVLMLAGCSDSTGDAEALHGDSTEGAASIPAPTWAIGDWWIFDLPGLGQITWVVSEDNGDHWTLDVNDPEMAFFHAAFGEVSTVGAISKKHLDGSQEHGAVHFFDFPLTEGKTWKFAWDDTEWSATGTFLANGKYAVQATAADGSVRNYGYDPTTQWLSGMEALDANGTVEFGSTFVKAGHNYSGELVRWTLFDRIDINLPTGDVRFSQFTVPEEAAELWYALTGTCSAEGLEGDQGAYELDIGSQASNYQNGIQVRETCPGTIQEGGVMAPDPGTWGVIGVSAGGNVDVSLIPRTLERFRLA